MKLYGYWRSSSTWRLRIAFEHKGVAYQYQPVNLLQGEHVDEEHLERNPRGQVPVVELPHGVFLAESLAILLWLEETWPRPTLMPSDTTARAKVWQAAEIVNAGIQPLQNLAVLNEIERLGGDRRQWASHWISRGLDSLEMLARTTAGTFFYRDDLTIADCCIVPQLYNARRFGVDLDPYPTLRRIEANCEQDIAFIKAHPDRQPDAR